MINVGDIIAIKNICFDEKILDHAFKLGRPCIFIGEYGENMYFVPISSNGKSYLKIKPTKENNLTKLCAINVKQIIEKPIAFYEAHGRLSDEDIANMFISIKRYYRKITDDKTKIIVDLANKYIEENSIVSYVDKDEKENKRKKDIK